MRIYGHRLPTPRSDRSRASGIQRCTAISLTRRIYGGATIWARRRHCCDLQAFAPVTHPGANLRIRRLRRYNNRVSNLQENAPPQVPVPSVATSSSCDPTKSTLGDGRGGQPAKIPTVGGTRFSLSVKATGSSPMTRQSLLAIG
jgi:hypothetical protein